MSYRRGVTPWISFLSEGTHFQDACAADQVIGTAAVLVLVIARVKSAYASVMSKSGIHFLAYDGILVFTVSWFPAISVSPPF